MGPECPSCGRVFDHTEPGLYRCSECGSVFAYRVNAPAAGWSPAREGADFVDLGCRCAPEGQPAVADEQRANRLLLATIFRCRTDLVDDVVAVALKRIPRRR